MTDAQLEKLLKTISFYGFLLVIVFAVIGSFFIINTVMLTSKLSRIDESLHDMAISASSIAYKTKP